MRFSDVLEDLEKMIGKRLESIRKGSEIILDRIDPDGGSLQLTTNTGAQKSRPLRELEAIWAELCSKAPVHVDTVLGGSGSSRNQPETIMANLPYIEWLRVDGKKHLFLCDEKTHIMGTVKQMDSLDAENLKLQLKKQQDAKSKEAFSQIIVVSDDLRPHATLLEHCSGKPGKALQQGAYEFYTNHQRILLLSIDVAPDCLSSGTYPVIQQPKPAVDVVEFRLFGQAYSLYQNKGVTFLFC